MSSAHGKATFGHIDAASITHVVQAFDVYPDASVPKGWDVPLTVTSLLMLTRSIGLAPGLSTASIRSVGPIGDVTRRLLSHGIVSRKAPRPSTVRKALERTKQQVQADPEQFRRKLENLLSREDCGAIGWLDWSMRRAAVEHYQNSHTLVDEWLVPELALILGVPEGYVMRLNEQTSQARVVEDLSKGKGGIDLRNDVSRCFLLAALLRGIYHECLCAGKPQVAHHPLRTAFLPDLMATPLLFGGNKTAEFLAGIILWDALTETGLGNQLSRWVDNIIRIRQANMPGSWRFDLRANEDPEMSMRNAVTAAQEVGIHAIPHKLESFLPKVLGFCAGKGTGGLLAVALTPFQGCALALLAGEVVAEAVEAYSESLTRTGLQRVYGNAYRLARLKEGPGGRLSLCRLYLPL